MTAVVPRAPLILKRPPETNDELWLVMATMFGIEIPRVAVCPGHSAPFDAFADAFFARYPVTVWKASRGFGGKSFTLAALSHAEAALLKAEVKVLGGSASQSLRVQEVGQSLWEWPSAPVGLIRDMTKFRTTLRGKASVEALLASQRSVRGPHPQRLRLDEIDEMDIEILDSSLGQPMSTKTLTSQIVMSSTHQYPDKTMSKILERAAEKNWPVYQWCFRETVEPYGWLPQDAVTRKRQEVTQHMWDTEYDLQEPSFEGRAIDTDSVNAYFQYGSPDNGNVSGAEGKIYRFEKPDPQATYVTGVDWAKNKDWTIIDTFRTDVVPWRRVAWSRLGRRPWPVMVEAVNIRCREYRGPLYHDGTGVGNVVHDYLNVDRPNSIVMTGRVRSELFSDYIQGIESNEFISPMVDFAYSEHKFVSIDDLYGKGHPPDSVVAGAMAWAGRKKKIVISIPSSSTKSSHWRSL